jgi:preprotein translocase subunit YajC
MADVNGREQGVHPVWALAWLVVMAGVFYLLIWRPQQRRVATMRAVQDALRLGDEVVTTSGIYGTITALRDDYVELEVAPNTVLKVARGAIGTRLTPGAVEPSESDDMEHPNGTEGAA